MFSTVVFANKTLVKLKTVKKITIGHPHFFIFSWSTRFKYQKLERQALRKIKNKITEQIS